MNFQKSSIIPSARIPTHQRQNFVNILGMRLSSLPFRYLGSYLHKGITRSRYCVSLIQHIDDRLQGWDSKLLSAAGRLVLLGSVIAALPLHVIAPGGLPKSVIKVIHRKMAAFYWGRRHHWVSWTTICKPQDEGGLGLRDMNMLQRAYHCRIWWSYQQNSTLWSKYMHAKYGHRQDYIPRLTDSPIWKIICRIHSFCLTQTDGQGGHITWLPTPMGEFSLKSAYDTCRISSPKLLSATFIWYKHHSPSIQLFLWCLFNSAIPFEDYIGQYSTARPTQCPFCKSESAIVDHVFLYCSYVRPLWHYFASELHCPLPSSLRLRQYLLSWWYRSSFTSLIGVYKIVIPAIIVYNIWCGYTSIVYGDKTHITDASLRHSIRYDIILWHNKIAGSKIATGSLLHFSWLPAFQQPRPLMIRWVTPPSGRLKLNVDAAVGRHYAAGSAILRDHMGSCIGAISFRLPPCAPLHAEIQAAMFGILYFLPFHRTFILESDCAQLIDRLSWRHLVHGNYHLRQLHTLVHLHRLDYHHIYREANMAAHYLAQHAMLNPRTQHYTSHTLPSLVRASILLDLTSSYLRVP